MGKVRARAKCLDIIQSFPGNCKTFLKLFPIFSEAWIDRGNVSRATRRGGHASLPEGSPSFFISTTTVSPADRKYSAHSFTGFWKMRVRARA